jgi:hypothetical protein
VDKNYFDDFFFTKKKRKAPNVLKSGWDPWIYCGWSRVSRKKYAWLFEKLLWSFL